MSLTGELVLADGVQIFRVADLAPEAREGVPHDPGDFAVSRPRSREMSRIIDARSRELLHEFEKPTRIVDAVLRVATRRGDDPEATLEEAYDMLSRLYRASVLVAPQARANHAAGPRPVSGEVLFGWTLGHCVHDLEDTKVFFARDAEGRAAAAKFVRGRIDHVEREAASMRRAGARVPKLYGAHARNDGGVLITEWVFGDEATRAARGLRGAREVRSEERLLTLCCEIRGCRGRPPSCRGPARRYPPAQRAHRGERPRANHRSGARHRGWGGLVRNTARMYRVLHGARACRCLASSRERSPHAGRRAVRSRSARL